MQTNPKSIALQEPKRGHPGFVDALGKKLSVGDEIIVASGDHVYHGVIHRFTPKRIYWEILYLADHRNPGLFKWENFCQLHYWYSKSENDRTLRKVLRIDEPAVAETAEVTQEAEDLLSAIKATKELMEAKLV